MAQFRYTARDFQGRAHKGVAAAMSAEELEGALRERGLFLVEAEVLSEAAAKRSQTVARDIRLSRRRLIEFTVELESTYTAGIPLVQALEDLGREDENTQLADILRVVVERIKEGSTLSEALATFPKAFPPLYTALAAAGEKTGTLDKVLRNIITFLEWQDELVSMSRQATIYPAVILAATAGLVVLLVGYVIPKFYGVFAALRIELPLPTRMLMAASGFFQQNALRLGIAAAALGAFVFLAGKTRRGRWAIDSAKLMLPIFGPLFRKILLSRMSHNLSMMLSAGIEVAAAFTMTEQLLGNVVMGHVVSRAREQIIGGGSVSEALGESRFVPRSVVRKLAVGESTGKLNQSLEGVAAQYDREVPRAVKRFFSLLEPTILVVLGGVVGFVALSLFLPLYQLQDAITR